MSGDWEKIENAGAWMHEGEVVLMMSVRKDAPPVIKYAIFSYTNGWPEGVTHVMREVNLPVVDSEHTAKLRADREAAAKAYDDAAKPLADLRDFGLDALRSATQADIDVAGGNAAYVNALLDKARRAVWPLRNKYSECDRLLDESEQRDREDFVRKHIDAKEGAE